MDDMYLLTNLLYRMTMWDEHEANNSDSKLAVKYWKKHIHQRKEPEEELRIYQLLLQSLDDEEFDYKSITPIFKLSNIQIRNYLIRIEPEITAYVTGSESMSDKAEKLRISFAEPSDKVLLPWFIRGWNILKERYPEKYDDIADDIVMAAKNMQKNIATIEELKLIVYISDRDKNSYSMLPFEVSPRELKNVPFAKEKRFRRIKKMAIKKLDGLMNC